MNNIPIITPTIITSYTPNLDLTNIDSKYRDYFIDIYNEISKIKNVNLEFLKKNISTLKIQEMENIYKKEKIRTNGRYNSLENKIILYNNNIDPVIYHEGLHMATTTHDNNSYHIGFYQFTKYPYKSNIGYGITEGYTTLQNMLLFKDHYNDTAYLIEKAIALMTLILVGQDKMDKLFFNADLYGLIKELDKYNDRDNNIKFIMNIDYLKDMTCKVNNQNQKDKIIECISDIEIYLMKCIMKKVKNNKNKDEIIDKYCKTLFEYEEAYRNLFNNLYSLNRNNTKKQKI